MYIYICMYVCMCVHTYMHIYIYIYTHIHTLYIYVYIYVYTHTYNMLHLLEQLRQRRVPVPLLWMVLVRLRGLRRHAPTCGNLLSQASWCRQFFWHDWSFPYWCVSYNVLVRAGVALVYVCNLRERESEFEMNAQVGVCVRVCACVRSQVCVCVRACACV